MHDVTSTESLDYAALLTRMNKLELEDDCNLPQLLTAALGLTAESGEFTEIVKKIKNLKNHLRSLNFNDTSLTFLSLLVSL